MLADGAIVGIGHYLGKHGYATGSCDLPIGTRLTKDYIHNELGYSGCIGFIDVNGLNLPNEETACSNGKDAEKVEEPCIVKGRDIKDIYPVLFHNATVEHITAPGKYVLNTAK